MGSALGGIAGGAITMAQGGGGAAPSLDLSQERGQANATYGTATSDAAQTMGTAKAYNQNAQNVLGQTSAANSNAANQVMNTANQSLKNYGSTFLPLQQQQAQQAGNYTSGANVSRLTGQAVAQQNAGTQAALQNQRAQLASEGVDPASVHGSALTQQAAIEGGANAAGAGTQASINAQLTGAGLMNQANQVGLNSGQQGTSEAATGANILSGNVSNTNQTNQVGINNMTAANQYLNTGIGANNSAVNAGVQGFNAAQQTYQDQQAASASQGSGLGSMIGGAAGLMAMEGGGPISSRGALPYPIVPGTTDSKLIAATPGEFMLPKDVTEYLGHQHIHKMINKARADIAARQGIPMHHQLSSAHMGMGA